MGDPTTIQDSIARAKAIKEELSRLPDVQRELRQARADAIREALMFKTGAAVAAELGISRSRLYKILHKED